MRFARTMSVLLALLVSLMPATVPAQAAPQTQAPTRASTQAPATAEPMAPVSLAFSPRQEMTAAMAPAQADLTLYAAEAIAEFQVTVQTEGAAQVEGPATFTLPGTAAGTEVQAGLAYSSRSEGEGTVRLTVRAMRPDGTSLPVLQAEIDMVAEEGDVYHGTDGKLDLKLKHVEKRRQQGRLSDDEYRKAKDKTKGAGARTEARLTEAGVAAAGFITVEGTILYTDAAGNTHPVRGAEVEIIDEDTLFDDLVATVTTDDTGRYSATVQNDTGTGENGLDIIVRVKTEASSFSIEGGGAFGDVHRIESCVKAPKNCAHADTPDGKVLTINLTANNTDDNNTAFSVYDSLITGTRYVQRVNGAQLRNLEVNFPKAGGVCGKPGTSCYDGDLNIAKLDRFDWDVILHEFGHFVADELDAEDSPGGSHGFGENLAETGGRNKSSGLRLAWGEGWATYFAIVAQQVEGAAALGLPNVGDTSYSETEETTWSLNIEGGGGKGEDDELSVVGALWDVVDAADDGDDKGVSLGDKLVWDTIKSARPVTLSDFFQALTNGKSMKEIAPIGCVFTENTVAPRQTAPADGHQMKQENIPTFTWDANGGGPANRNNKFVVEFYNEDMSSQLFASSELATNQYTPTEDDWKTIRGDATVSKVNWVVKGTQTNSPTTGPYVSCAREMKKPSLDLIFLIDTTGSMWDDIGSVKSSASSILDAIAADGRDFRVAVADYKDHPVAPHGEPGDYPYRAVLPFSNDRAAITGAVNSLSASGGYDWPESVYSGLMGAIGTNGLGAWRKDAEKIIIVMADAPPHDPEPVTGLTHAQVVAAARAAGVDTRGASAGASALIAAATAGPTGAVTATAEAAAAGSGARIFSIVVGYDSAAYNAFAQLSADTGGNVFRAASASQVVRAILEAIGSIDDTPAPTNQAPDVAGALASLDKLWPVNHRMVEVQVQNVVDPDGDPVTITITGIRQNEPVRGPGSGNSGPDGEGVGTGTARVRAERSGRDTDRIYRIFFAAEDDKGGRSEGSVLVCVPHDNRPNTACESTGEEYDSTAP